MDRFVHVQFAAVDDTTVLPRAHASTPSPDPGTTELSPDIQQAILFRSLLRTVGLSSTSYRSGTLVRRWTACLRALGCQDGATAMRQLHEYPVKRQAAVDAILLGVTDFFRDPPVFQALAGEILPRLLARGCLRVVSVGCSSGAEVYSVLMLADSLAPEAQVEALGIDCRPNAIAAARNASFPADRLSSIPPEFRGRYVTQTRQQCVINEKLWLRADWKIGDALRAELGPPADLLLCRNLVIYLRTREANRLWQRLAAAVRPGGYLCVGKAERPTCPGFRFVAPCLYERVQS